jgi:hypothetical protein
MTVERPMVPFSHPALTDSGSLRASPPKPLGEPDLLQNHQPGAADLHVPSRPTATSPTETSLRLRQVSRAVTARPKRVCEGDFPLFANSMTGTDRRADASGATGKPEETLSGRGRVQGFVCR